MDNKSSIFFKLSQNQSQKEIIINENFVLLDKLFNKYIKSIKLSSPPLEEVQHYLYIVGQDAKNEWSGQENKIAYYRDGWQFIEPGAGAFFYVYEEKAFYGFNGNNWEKLI